MIGQFVLKVISYWLTANNRKLINFLSTQFFNLRKCIESIFEEHYNWNDSNKEEEDKIGIKWALCTTAQAGNIKCGYLRILLYIAVVLCFVIGQLHVLDKCVYHAICR